MHQIAMRMKKYLLVCWDQYYPLGSLRNIKGSFDTLEEARAEYTNFASFDCAEIVDRDTLETVWEK
jgi:hypothetical protein